MTSQAAHLNDDEFLFGYLSEYMDGTLDDEQTKRFEAALKNHKDDNLVTNFGIAKGHLQLKVQKLYVDEPLNHDLHILVEDDAERANHEAEDIEDYGQTEVIGSILRGAVITILVGLFFGSAHYYFGPKPSAKFSALDTLVYESVVMIEDPTDRLDFPTSSLSEIKDYFNRYPGLDFRVDSLKKPGEGWMANGSTVIDYEVQKIAAVQFSNGDDSMFYFLFEGSFDNFPKSELGNFKGILYQAYTSEYFNVVVWELDEDVVGMAVGGGTSEQLAKSVLNSFGTPSS